MRITVLTQWFEPEPAYRGQEFACGLVAMGYDVDVVTGFPNYPGGKLYDGYKLRPMQVELLEGIRVTRLPLYPSHDRGKVGRSLNYVTFMLSAYLFLLFRFRRVDVVYVYHPPITVGFAAVLAKIVRRYAVVLEIQDLWPDTLTATGMIRNPKMLGAINKVCNWVYKQSDQIVAQSEGFRTKLIERGVDARKVTTIRGWAQKDVLLASAGEEAPGYRPDDRLRIVFAGNMGKAQSLETVLTAARQLVLSCPGATFYLIGDGGERAHLEEIAESDNLSNVVFLPRVPLTKVGAFLSRADVLLVHLRDDPLFRITIPSKTQAYMAVGKPIIMGVRGEAAELVTIPGAGVAVEPDNPDALEAAIIKLAGMDRYRLTQMGERGSSFYDEHLSQARGMSAFEETFQKAIRLGGAE